MNSSEQPGKVRCDTQVRLDWSFLRISRFVISRSRSPFISLFTCVSWLAYFIRLFTFTWSLSLSCQQIMVSKSIHIHNLFTYIYIFSTLSKAVFEYVLYSRSKLLLPTEQFVNIIIMYSKSTVDQPQCNPVFPHHVYHFHGLEGRKGEREKTREGEKRDSRLREIGWSMTYFWGARHFSILFIPRGTMRFNERMNESRECIGC